MLRQEQGTCEGTVLVLEMTTSSVQKELAVIEDDLKQSLSHNIQLPF